MQTIINLPVRHNYVEIDDVSCEIYKHRILSLLSGVLSLSNDDLQIHFWVHHLLQYFTAQHRDAPLGGPNSFITVRNVVFTPVCHSLHREGVCHTPPGQTPPPGLTPPLDRHPLDRHPPAQTTSLGKHPPAQCMLGYTPLVQCMLDTHPLAHALLKLVAPSGKYWIRHWFLSILRLFESFGCIAVTLTKLDFEEAGEMKFSGTMKTIRERREEMDDNPFNLLN